MGNLTRQQKEAIAWVDVAAGLASAETGPVSFLIAAAASMAYYKDKVASEGWSAIVINDDPVIPSTSNNQGVLHNLTCEKYLRDGYAQVTYDRMLITAAKVRPDLTNNINSITQDYFNQKVEKAMQENLISLDSKLDVVRSTVPLNDANSDTLFQLLTTIDNSGTDDEYLANVQNMIGIIPSFDLNDYDKMVLTNAFDVLNNSYQLWSK